MAPDTDIAWAAGLFEGEGCMNSHPRGKRGSGTQLRLAMTDRDVVERFAAVIGCGNIHRPRHDPRPNHKPVYTWALYESARVVEVIELLMPWFGERRRAKAMEVLAVARDIDVHKGKRTHCPNGHPYEGDNLIEESITGNGGKVYTSRRCRTCRRAQARRRKRERTA